MGRMTHSGIAVTGAWFQGTAEKVLVSRLDRRHVSRSIVRCTTMLFAVCPFNLANHTCMHSSLLARSLQLLDHNLDGADPVVHILRWAVRTHACMSRGNWTNLQTLTANLVDSGRGGDGERLLAQLGHLRLAVQWDVACAW